MKEYKIQIKFKESPVVSEESVCDLIIKAESLENAVQLVTNNVAFPFHYRIYSAQDITPEETP